MCVPVVVTGGAPASVSKPCTAAVPVVAVHDPQGVITRMQRKLTHTIPLHIHTWWCGGRTCHLLSCCPNAVVQGTAAPPIALTCGSWSCLNQHAHCLRSLPQGMESHPVQVTSNPHEARGGVGALGCLEAAAMHSSFGACRASTGCSRPALSTSCSRVSCIWFTLATSTGQKHAFLAVREHAPHSSTPARAPWALCFSTHRRWPPTGATASTQQQRS